jgi:hypothetical protein
MNVKYPKTLHLPWSLGLSGDDKLIHSLDVLSSNEIVVTEKLDGECTGMDRMKCHARSLDSKDHPSRHRVKSLHATIKHEIPDNFKIFGENVYAKHSIHYRFLTTYFYVFGIYMEDICLSWDDTVEFASVLGLKTTPVLYRGPWDIEKIKSCWSGRSYFSQGDDFDPQEGYVIRVTSAFPFVKHSEYTAKFVRKGHIQTDEHWLNQPVVPNLTIQP